MRLGSYRPPGGRDWRACLYPTPDTVLDLADALHALPAADSAALRRVREWPDPTDIGRWVGVEGLEVARHLLDAQQAGRLSAPLLALSQVVQGPPLTRPDKFIAVGRNYMNHVREGQQIWAARGRTVALPTFPASFVKFASAITPTHSPLPLPQGVADVDYEIELALVIGKPAYRVSVEEALDYVAGYTICNDVGARQIQRQEMESQIGLTLSKNFRGFAPLGPWLVTADEIGDPQQLELRLTVNGEERQHASTADMIFPVAQLVSYWSQVGLAPGDLITTGTPAGVALARPDPQRFYLKPGDVVRASISRIGELVNTVQDEGAPA